MRLFRFWFSGMDCLFLLRGFTVGFLFNDYQRLFGLQDQIVRIVNEGLITKRYFFLGVCSVL